MIEILGYVWLRPYWVVLIPIALLAGLFLLRRNNSLGAWERAIDPELLTALRRLGRVHTGQGTRYWWPVAALVAAAAALAGPAAESRTTALYRNLDAIILVIDLSDSVANGPAFRKMQTTAHLLANATATRPVGLVVYAGEAYVAAPPSWDREALTGALSLLDGETVPVPGSRPDEGLTAAREMLAKANILVSDVVLLTDGDGVTPETLAAAGHLAEDGSRVSAISVGTDGVPGALSGLARASGGTAATTRDPYPVADLIAQRPTERLARAGFANLVYRDFGRYLLVFVLVALFFMLPRRGTA